MLKPAGARCNLSCSYCYYLDKALLYADEKRHWMTDETLERFIRQYIEAQTSPNVLFTWHGGETMLRPLSFYKRAVQLQREVALERLQKEGVEMHIDNCLQTNGTLITPEWARFLHDEQWLVGVSIDGPEEFHDEYRRSHDGRPTWAKVRRGIDILNKYGVEWNAMAVVNDYNADYPLDFYRFFRDELQCRFLQFTPIVEPPSASLAGTRRSSSIDTDGSTQWQMGESAFPGMLTPTQWGDFLCSVFDEWVHNDVGEMFVQIFDATLAGWMGVAPGLCTMARDCGHAGVMEWNGDVYSCDHFVSPEHLLGNIHQTPVYQLMHSPQQEAFARIKHDALPDQCLQCPWLKACHGECSKNRFIDPSTGQPFADAATGQPLPFETIVRDSLRLRPLNYLCPGYKRFFQHAAPYMDTMRQLLLNGQEAREVMRLMNS